MKNSLNILTAGAITAIFISTGCAKSKQSLPLIYVQTKNFGVSAGSGISEQGIDLVVGYKEKNAALVPVAIESTENGMAQVGSMSGESFDDAFSVLGQFEANINGESQSVSLGSFFSTGAAAKALADGFSAKMGNVESDED